MAAAHVEIVRDTVMNDMARGHYRPGAGLPVLEVAARSGCSGTPAREGLQRLVGEGALREVRRRGFFIPQLTPAAIAARYEGEAAVVKAMLEYAKAEDRGEHRRELGQSAAGDHVAPGRQMVMLLAERTGHPGLRLAWRALDASLICYRRVEADVVDDIDAMFSDFARNLDRADFEAVRKVMAAYYRKCVSAVAVLCDEVMV